MSNKEKLSWCAGVVLLVLLYLLSSTDLIIKEKEKEICRISVIIDNVNDNYYGNFREGMETICFLLLDMHHRKIRKL